MVDVICVDEPVEIEMPFARFGSGYFLIKGFVMWHGALLGEKY